MPYLGSFSGANICHTGVVSLLFLKPDNTVGGFGFSSMYFFSVGLQVLAWALFRRGVTRESLRLVPTISSRGPTGLLTWLPPLPRGAARIQGALDFAPVPGIGVPVEAPTGALVVFAPGRLIGDRRARPLVVTLVGLRRVSIIFFENYSRNINNRHEFY